MISIVTPAFNERSNLPMLYERLTAVLRQVDWEWIIVDDHSRDDTFAVIELLVALDSRIKGIRLARKLAATSAMQPFVAGEYRPGVDAVTDDELLEFARNTGGTIFHPSGTTKMGPDSDPMAVVDPQLRVHGIEALRVVDCGIMPTLVSGNTNVPVVMIAEKAASMILGDTQ